MDPRQMGIPNIPGLPNQPNYFNNNLPIDDEGQSIRQKNYANLLPG